ncbi:MAG TPA: hypothetical protein VE995_09295 [Gaiellaceae bacterium]|nr:hypothetical protein [Gaiellaceae bacterium]
MQLVDKQPEERLCLLRVSFGDDGFEVVSDRGEFGSGKRTCGLVRRLKGDLGFLRVKVVEARLEAGESVFAAFG